MCKIIYILYTDRFLNGRRPMDNRIQCLWINCLCSDLGAILTSELDRSEIDLSQKRSECERSNAN